MNAPPSPELTPHLKEADRGATVPTDRPVRVVVAMTSASLYSLSSGAAANP